MPNDKRRSARARPRRLRLVIAYDGSGFAGWQSQANADTIQARIEAALRQVTGEQLRVHGAGRTDAGVHALGQCAHVDLPSTTLSAAVLADALNAFLPPAIRIMRSRFVTTDFHARFSARGKVYRYRMVTARVLPPLELGRAWHVIRDLDDRRMRDCVAAFIGQHDFADFAANRGHPPTSTVRRIRAARVRRSAQSTTLEFDGDGFLYKMVRLMVGATVRCASGRSSVAEVQARLRGELSDPVRLVAPAGGLTLLRVRY